MAPGIIYKVIKSSDSNQEYDENNLNKSDDRPQPSPKQFEHLHPLDKSASESNDLNELVSCFGFFYCFFLVCLINYCVASLFVVFFLLTHG